MHRSSTLCSIFASWFLISSVPGCGSGDDCTAIGCTNDATVTFGEAVDGPYDLVVDTDAGSFTARCNDPGAPEVADNAPEVSCNATGFGLTGDAALGHSIVVSITPLEMDPLIEGTEVLLSVVDERRPNGEGCPPACFSRVGDLMF